MSNAQDGLKQALEFYEKASSKVRPHSSYIEPCCARAGGTGERAFASAVTTQSSRGASVVITGSKYIAT